MRKNLNWLLALIYCSCAGPASVNAQTTYTVGNTVLTQTDLVTGIELPWEILWGADDYIWATLRTGYVLRIDPLTGNYTTILDLSSSMPYQGSSEPGMLGMALHPDFLNTPKVYLVYCYTSGNTIKERLVSLDWDGNNLVNETTLINAIAGNSIHNGSRIVISPDNKIMMTTGDTGTGGALSQNLSSKNGKVLRINLDGSIPVDNPDPTSYVWSFGHRNGQGLVYGPSGILYESEHGQSNHDEFNIIEPNRNYGWPTVEGFCTAGNQAELDFCASENVREPLIEWSPCRAVNGISYYNHEAIPEWSNSIIMAVLGGLGGDQERISVLHLTEDGLSVINDETFTTQSQRFRDICINPYTGAIYVALNGPSTGNTNYPGQGPNKILEFRNMEFVANVKAAPTIGQELNIFPNPASKELNFSAAQSLVGTTLKVFSYAGILIKEIKVTGINNKIDISDLSEGNYWLMGQSALGTVTKSFIKSN